MDSRSLDGEIWSEYPYIKVNTRSVSETRGDENNG